MKKKLINSLILFFIICVIFFATKFIRFMDVDNFIYDSLRNIINIPNKDMFLDDSTRYAFLIFFALYIFGINFSKLARRILIFGFLPIYFTLSIVLLQMHIYDFALFRNITFFLSSYLIVLFYYYIRYERLHSKEISDNKLLARIDEQGMFEEISVLFVDIQNYTGISEKLGSPTLIYKFLNYYISYIENIIVKYDGILDKVMGDGIMLIFKGKNKEKRSVKCALEIMKKKGKFVESLKKNAISNLKKGFVQKENLEKGIISEVLEEFNFNFKVGIATGSVFMGNIGGKEINATTVIGEVVNIAYRLEGLNKIYRTNILTDQKTAVALGENFTSRFVDKIRVRGKNEITNVYQPFRYKNDIISIDFSKESMMCWNEFMKNYYKKNFQQAFETIETYIKSNPKDKLSIVYYNRLQSILQSYIQIPSDWDGTRDSKYLCD